VRNRGLIICLAAVAYGLTAYVIPKGGFWINDNGCKYLQVVSLFRNGVWNAAIDWLGEKVDPEFRFAPLQPPFGYVIDGKLYAQYPPFFAAVSAVPFRWLGTAGLYLLPFAGGLATLAAVWRLAQLVSEKDLANAASSVLIRETDGSAIASTHRKPVTLASTLAVFVVGLGTPLWFYSVTFWEHTPAVALIAWSVVLYLQSARKRASRSPWPSAVLLGAATYFRDDTYLLAGAWILVLAASRESRRAVPVLVATLVAAWIPLWLYHAVAIGHPLGLHFRGAGPLDGGIGTYFAERWLVIRNLLLDSHGNSWVSLLCSTALWFSGAAIAVRGRNRSWNTIWIGIAVLAAIVVGAGHLTATQPMWYLMSSNSLLAAAPVLVPCALRWGASPAAARFVWKLSMVYTGIYCVVAPPLNTDGIHWGCRFLLPIYALLGTMAGVGIADHWSQSRFRLAFRLAAGMLVGVSVWMQVYSVSLLYRRQGASAKLNEAIARKKADAWITDGWFLPQEFAFDFPNRPVFLLTRPDDWPELRARLVQAGMHDVLFVYALGDSDRPPESVEIVDDAMRFIRIGLATEGLDGNP